MPLTFRLAFRADLPAIAALLADFAATHTGVELRLD